MKFELVIKPTLGSAFIQNQVVNEMKQIWELVCQVFDLFKTQKPQHSDDDDACCWKRQRQQIT